MRCQMYLATVAISLIAPVFSAPEIVANIKERAVKTVTKTVPAPSGFIPIRSSLPTLSCDDDCGSSPVVEPAQDKLARAAKASTTTVYAACATDNFADLWKGRSYTSSAQGITGEDQINSFAMLNTSYDCCVYAFTRDYPVGVWQFAEDSCLLYDTDKGSGGQANNTYQLFTSQKQYQSTFGNGPNGEVIKASRYGHKGGP